MLNFTTECADQPLPLKFNNKINQKLFPILKNRTIDLSESTIV